MYYRRKIILSLLEKFGGEMDNTRFQKLLFLFTKEQEKPSFDFVPYKYGPFSFLSYQDKRTMMKYEQLSDKDNWEKMDTKIYYNELTSIDKSILDRIYIKFYEFSDSQIINYVYSNFPEYTINSEIKTQLSVKEKTTKDYQSSVFFTIGYEGCSIDEYLHILIKNNIKMLCDVRKNPISMKYGFSKNQLKNLLIKLDIGYQHIPELGIESFKRINLNKIEDYNKLFNNYYNKILPVNDNSVNNLIKLFTKHKRIAITCFEADYNFCHRHKIAEYLQSQKDSNIKITHL